MFVLFVLFASFAVINADVNAFTTSLDAVTKLFANGESVTVPASSALRTQASSGWLQIIDYSSGSNCKGNVSSVSDIALNTCFPLGFFSSGNSTIITASGNVVTATGYSDRFCKTLTKSKSIVANSCNITGSANGVSSYVYTTSALPPTAFISKFYQINLFQSTCSSTQLIALQFPGSSSGPSGCTSVKFDSGQSFNATYVNVIPSTTKSPAFAPVSTPTSSSTSSCFAGSETVELASGEVRAIANVRVGDEIAVASMDGTFAGYSPVIAVPHAANSIKATFAQITTVSGRGIKMTPDHLMLGGACAFLSLVQAGSLKIGECVQTVSGAEVVASVITFTTGGIYTVVTKHDGLLIVNGIVASPFAVNHLIANSFYNVVRFVYDVMPTMSQTSIIGQVIGAFGDVVTGVFA